MQITSKILILFSVLCFVWGILSAREAEPKRKPIRLPGLENGVMKIRDVPGTGEENSVEMPQIRVDNRRIRYVKRNPDGTVTLPGGGLKTNRKQKWRKETPVPFDSLAANVTGKISKLGIQWTPLRTPGTVHGVRIPDVQLSADQSLFAFVETTGEPDGPYGSRIILMNSHNWNILRIISTDRLIKRICFMNGTTKLAALCETQPVMKQKAGLAVFHLKSGEETAFRVLPAALSSNIISDNRGRLYLSHKTKNEIWRFEQNIFRDYRILRTDSKNPIIAISPNGQYIAAGSGEKGVIRVYKLSDLRPIFNAKLPKDYPLSQLIFIDNEKQFFCAADPLQNTAAIVVRDQQSFELKGNNAGFNAITGDGKYLIHCKKVRGELEVIHGESLDRENFVVPEMIHPVTRGGDPVFVFPLEASGTLAVLDSKGNFYLLYLPKNGKRYQKETVFMPVNN
ncbi:MAG: WD40 repeat domain-containing protein [Lentisphaeria bacterium]|nr:WD40 repeat domain-containing protein [Lentisphaeria bacterium]